MNVLQQASRKQFFSAQNIIITAGAGMGVDSGLPDFRGNKGFLEGISTIKWNSI